MKQEIIEENLEIPAGIKVKIDGPMITVEGPKGKVQRKLFNPNVSISQDSNHIKILAKEASRREKQTIGTFKAHLKNMVEGAQEGYTYRLKICSGHFPMTVAMKGNELTVKNYIGEKVPRILKIKPGADVKVEGEFIVITSNDKELAGQAAASIEKLTSRSAYDRRVFQDGIYIIEKAGKEIR
jgi:large subunit ribosomal protein L6